ncbi:MAG: hypothetical protein HC828_20320, partial [Blastochloris sp.]|nr:hypothetical protein [Blastochloris sp.]
MAKRPSHTPEHHESNALLSTLLETPVEPAPQPLRPVALRSAAEQRRLALRGVRCRTWVDQLLYRTERLLVLAMVAVFAYWFLDGYGRDWLYAWQQQQVSAAASTLASAHAPDSPDTPTNAQTNALAIS